MELQINQLILFALLSKAYKSKNNDLKEWKIYLGFFQTNIQKRDLKRLSFQTQFMIQFLLPFTSYIIWTPFLILITILVGGGNLKNYKKWGGSKYGAGAGIFKKDGGSWHFSYLIFPRFIIFTFRNDFTLCKIVLCICRFFFCHHNEKVILSCLKMNLKISNKLR